MITGIVTVMFSFPVATNPSKTRCSLSRTWLEDANTDKKDWNNVDTGGVEAKDLACADAVRLLEQVPLNEKGTKRVTVPSASALQIQNLLAIAVGIAQVVSGFFLNKSLSRRARTAAIGSAIGATVLQALGILSLGTFIFVMYALAFSAASRVIWPREAPRG